MRVSAVRSVQRQQSLDIGRAGADGAAEYGVGIEAGVQHLDGGRQRAALVARAVAVFGVAIDDADLAVLQPLELRVQQPAPESVEHAGLGRIGERQVIAGWMLGFTASVSLEAGAADKSGRQ